jgi:serine/threonine-protein kinase
LIRLLARDFARLAMARSNTRPSDKASLKRAPSASEGRYSWREQPTTSDSDGDHSPLEWTPEPPPRPRAHAGDVVGDRYRLEHLVGSGGMSTVWAADDLRLARRVAVKIVPFDEVSPEVPRERFKREAELSRQLRGPAFVKVFDHGMEEHRAYLVMELLEGESLHERLVRAKRLTLEELLVLVRGMSSGLRVAHALQIVHRDLKPSNVFFGRVTPGKSGVHALDGAREHVKLLDFGIAKDTWADARLTAPGMLLGSAHYMSPEQTRSGRDVDVRSDLWSLGVILYRAITGKRPFEGTPTRVLVHIALDQPTPPTRVVSGLPYAMDDFFRRALAKDASKRFQSIDEMEEAFAEIIDAIPDDQRPTAEVRTPLVRLNERPTVKTPGASMTYEEYVALTESGDDHPVPKRAPAEAVEEDEIIVTVGESIPAPAPSPRARQRVAPLQPTVARPRAVPERSTMPQSPWRTDIQRELVERRRRVRRRFRLALFVTVILAGVAVGVWLWSTGAVERAVLLEWLRSMR